MLPILIMTLVLKPSWLINVVNQKINHRWKLWMLTNSVCLQVSLFFLSRDFRRTINCECVLKMSEWLMLICYCLLCFYELLHTSIWAMNFLYRTLPVQWRTYSFYELYTRMLSENIQYFHVYCVRCHLIWKARAFNLFTKFIT